MFKFANIVVVLSVLAIPIFFVSSQDDETNEERDKQCEYLNSVRANLTICCRYPVFVIWRWQLKRCEQQCADNGQENDRCCITPCGMYLLGVLNENKNEDGSPARATINATGIAYSFMLSVGNDTQWTPVITESSKNCVSQFDGEGGGVDCDVIPESLYDILDCEYSRNYQKCPTWNPYGIEACQYTYQFVKLCMAGA